MFLKLFPRGKIGYKSTDILIYMNIMRSKIKNYVHFPLKIDVNLIPDFILKNQFNLIKYLKSIVITIFLFFFLRYLFSIFNFSDQQDGLLFVIFSQSVMNTKRKYKHHQQTEVHLIGMLTSLLSFRFREISNLYTGKGCSPPHWAVYSNGGTNLLQLNYSKKIDHVIKV